MADERADHPTAEDRSDRTKAKEKMDRGTGESLSGVLVFSADYKPSAGGVAEHAFKLAHAVKRVGVRVVVLAPRLEGDRDFDGSAGLRTYRVPRFSFLTPVFYFFALLHIVRRHRIGFVYCVTSHPSGLVCAAASLLRRFRYSVTIHGHEVLYVRKGLRQTLKCILKPLQIAVLNRAYRVFVVSEFTGANAVAAGVKSSKVHVIFNGIDLADFREPMDLTALMDAHGLGAKPIILTVGRLVERKGHDVLIRAMPDVLGRVPNAAYVIVGDGPERSRLEHLAAELGLTDCVHVTGRLPRGEVIGMLARCRIFAMVNRQVANSVEGFGIVFLEAGALGKPVVGGRSGGVPDAVEDGVTGLLVDPMDVRAVSEAVSTLLLDPGLARRMGEAGYERVRERFTWDSVAARVLEGMGDL